MASRRDLIVDAVVAALRGISTDAGYNTDAGLSVQRATLPQNNFSTMPALIVSLGGESKRSGTTIDITCDLRVQIEAYPAQGNGEIVGPLDDLVEDVERALLAQRELDPVLGVPGCEDLEPEGHDPFVEERLALVGALVRVNVLYHHDVDDPSTYRGQS